MKLSEISIQNFKGLRDEVFCPKSFSCLVGENNAGKSTVLQALVYALNRPKNIPASMFYDEADPVVFKLKFEEVLAGDLNRLKPEHKTKMEPLIYGGELILTAKYSKADGLDLLISKLVPLDESLSDDAIQENFRGMRSATQAKTVVQDNYPQYLASLPDKSSPAQAKAYLNQKIAELDADQFCYRDIALPSGIPSSISALIPEPIYIPAVKNFQDDLKTTQSTSFGRLLGLLMDDLTPELQDINDTLLDLKKRLNRYVDDNGDVHDERLSKVVELESTIEGFLSENFPNVSVDLEIPPPEIKTILNTAQIYIDDGSRDLIDNKGDGVKRSLTFSLLRAYVDILSKRNAAAEEGETASHQERLEKPLIFLFEEPELYLHPKAQRVLFSTLAAISRNFQTVITTHSPLFFEPGVTAQFVRIAKEPAQPKPIGKLYPVDFEIDQENLNTFRMAKFDNSEAAFFSNHVVLYEGESDDFFFRHMAVTINSEWSFDDKNIALVEVGGKGNFSKFRKFFESFGLKVSILTDLDILIKDFHHLGATSETTEKKGQLLQTLNQRVEELGVSPQLTGSRVKKQCKNPRWIDKYESAKIVIEQVVETGNATAEQIESFHSLFEWETDESKYIVLTTDTDVKQEMTELIDRLREESIYVLSKGAIEQYYPSEIMINTSKPERALSVIQHISTREQAINLSNPMGDGRETEFEEIFSSIFERRS